MGKLILVPTPIGNLEDITLRAIRALEESDLIFAEDTRTSGNLLRHLNISKPLKAFHLNNEHKTLESALSIIKSNSQVALVSDAGTPGISDPGYLLVRACIQDGIYVECLPGPAALIPALVISGLPCDKFCFEGFLPHKKGRQTRFKLLADEKRTIVFYESPHRLLKTLEQCAEFFGDNRNAAVVREISKKFEQVHRGTIQELITYFEEHNPKGEIVLVVGGSDQDIQLDEESEETSAEDFLRGRAKRKKE